MLLCTMLLLLLWLSSTYTQRVWQRETRIKSSTGGLSRTLSWQPLQRLLVIKITDKVAPGGCCRRTFVARTYKVVWAWLWWVEVWGEVYQKNRLIWDMADDRDILLFIYCLFACTPDYNNARTIVNLATNHFEQVVVDAHHGEIEASQWSWITCMHLWDNNVINNDIICVNWLWLW